MWSALFKWGRESNREKASASDKMATLSDLKEVKEALDAGLVSQADYDDVKRDYLRAQKEAVVEFQKRDLLAKEEFRKREAEADLRAYALESIVKHGSSIMSEEQKVDLVRDYVRMSGLDCDVENDEPPSKRQRSSTEERDASPPQTSTPPPAAAASEDSSYSDDDGEDDYDERLNEPHHEPKTAKRCCKRWTEEDDAAFVAALRAGQSARSIRIPGRGKTAAYERLKWARVNGSGTQNLRLSSSLIICC